MKPSSLTLTNGTAVSSLAGGAKPATKAVVGSKLSKDLDIMAMESLESKENPIQK